MATYNEYIYDIIEGLRNNYISDDVNISNLNVGFHLSSQRATWLRNEFNKPGRVIDSQVVQTLCAKLIPVSASECDCVELDCFVLRTEQKIPKLLELHSGPALIRVGPVNITNQKFNFVPQEQAILSASNKYTKNSVYLFLYNSYLYMITNNTSYQTLEYLSIKGVFDNPLDLQNFTCNNESCFTLDSEYPLPFWMYSYVRELVIQQFKPRSLSDTANDAKEDVNKQ